MFRELLHVMARTLDKKLSFLQIWRLSILLLIYECHLLCGEREREKKSGMNKE